MKKVEIGNIIDKIKKHKMLAAIMVLIVMLILLWLYPMQAVQVSLQLKGCNSFGDGETMNVYFDIGNGIREEDSASAVFEQGNLLAKIDPRFNKSDAIRIDLEGSAGERTFTEVGIYSGAFTEDDYQIGRITAKSFLEAAEIHDIANVRITEQGVTFEVTGADPYFVLSEQGVKEFKRGVCNFWYFKLVLTIGICGIGLLILIGMKYPVGNPQTESKRRIALFVLCSVMVQVFFTWHVIRSVEEIPVLDTKKAVECTREGEEAFFEIDNLTNGLQHLYLKVEEIDAENPFVMQVNTIKITVYSEDGKTILLEEAVYKNDLVAKKMYEVTLAEHYDIEKCFVAFTNLENQDIGVIRISEQTAGRVVDRKPWLVGFALACNLAIMFVVLYNDIRWKKNIALGSMYSLFLIMTIFKMWVYRNYIHGFPDESYHVAYTAYLQSSQKIIPIFSDMRALSISGDTARFASLPAYNYLGHPPLYYHILRLANAMELRGVTFSLDLEKMRLFSGMIALLAFALILYIGYSRINKEKPYLHLFYAASVLCIPMMVYHVAGINNDTLALLGCALFFLGGLRFTEEKRDYKTFLLIAFGMTIALLSKLTAGAMLGLMSVLYIAWDALQHKTVKRFLCKEFFVSLPVYAVAVYYYIAVYIQMGSFTPRIKDMAKGGEYKPRFDVDFLERSEMSLLEYVTRFVRKFFTQWRGIGAHIDVEHLGSDDGVGTMLRIALWFLPILLFVGYSAHRKNSDGTVRKVSAKEMFLKLSYISIVVTAVLQLCRGTINFFYKTGYLGSHQSRYYLCVAMMLSFCIVYALEQREKIIGKGLNAILLLTVVYYMYSDFIFFLLSYTKYIGI